MSGILRHISTSTIVTTMINYKIARGRVSGLLRLISISNIFITMINYTIAIRTIITMSYITYRNFKAFIISNNLVIAMLVVIMAGLSIPISKTAITTHIEITCLSVEACNIVEYLKIGFVPFSWCYQLHWGMNCVVINISIISGDRYQCCWEMDCVGGEGHNFIYS